MCLLNPLIAEKSADTLLNVYAVNKFLSEYLDEQQFKDLPTKVNSEIAIGLVISCTNSALQYEIERLEELDNNYNTLLKTIAVPPSGAKADDQNGQAKQS